MDVDVSAHGVDGAEPVLAGLAAAQPEDAGENPVALRVRLGQGFRIDLSGRPASHEHRPLRAARADLRAYDVQPAGRAAATLLFARAVEGGGDGVLTRRRALPAPMEKLLAQADHYLRGHSSLSPARHWRARLAARQVFQCPPQKTACACSHRSGAPGSSSSRSEEWRQRHLSAWAA